MRTVILLDRSFAKREHDLLWRLEVGLADEGARVIHAVPSAILANEHIGLFSRSVGYDDGGFPISRSIRAADLLEAIERATETETDRNIDVVHAFGDATWALAIEVGRRSGAAVFLELWQAQSFALAAELVRRAERHGQRAPRFIIGDSSLLAAASQRVTRAALIHAPWGVHERPLRPAPEDPERLRGIAMLLDATSMPMIDAALAGVARLRSQGSPLMLFANVEATRDRSQAIWQLAKKHGVLEHFSMIPQAEARRAPLLEMDALVIPEPSGKLRSISLDAMGCGIPVIAAADPMVGATMDDRTAWLVREATPTAWATAIGDAIDPARAAPRLRAAQAFVHEHCQASGHISAVLRAYDSAIRESAAMSA